MSWRELTDFRDASVAKLDHLRRAANAGVRVPPTVWCPAHEAHEAGVGRPTASWCGGPLIVRSGSPTEDRADSTAAGQFVTLVVETADEGAFRDALERVVDALPKADGRPQGVVFVQPFLRPERGGIAFFDGYYFERTTAAGGNQELTSGRARGDVERGHLERSCAWSSWLQRLARVFPDLLRDGGTIDIEFAFDSGDSKDSKDVEITLLQARRAPFGVRRNPTLSLANHREILGDVPSPWMVDVLVKAGEHAIDFFAEIDPVVGSWNEPYAVALGGRAWLNVTAFYRLMDRWGLPRTFVTEGIGGALGSPEDGRFDVGRMLRASPRLLRLQLKNLATVAGAGGKLRELDAALVRSRSLTDLFDVSVQGLALALRTNFAINGALTGIARVRRSLGLRGRADVVTERMMEEYEALRGCPAEKLDTRLDRWLADFGHRGPLESDLARPRFFELRALLREELLTAAPGPARRASSAPRGRGPLYAMDRRREWFRDELMKRWMRLKSAILTRAEELVQAGELEEAGDVFLLTRDDLASAEKQELVSARRRERKAHARLALPDTASLDALDAACAQPLDESSANAMSANSYRGIALSPATFEGRIVKADDLVELLESVTSGSVHLGPDAVLLVTALEPSWAVVFPRVGAVVTELGGELSHASILLREAGLPAVVNCRGIDAGVEHGARVRLEGSTGQVTLIEQGAA